MEVSYYPGCSLQGMARSYNESIKSVASTLGVGLGELKDWTCCGASSAHMSDTGLAVALAARNLAIADRLGRHLVVPCAACFQRLKVAEKHLKQGKPVDGLSVKYDGNLQIKSMHDFFWEDVGEKEISERVKKPLHGLSPVCYYGCLTARPPKVTDAKNPDDPKEMDNVLKSLGANVMHWSFKTDCCGGSLTLTRPDILNKLVQKILDMASEAGADCIVVACPMCHENMDSTQAEISRESGKSYDVPIFYFSELMGLAFGGKTFERWIGRHSVDPKPLLQRHGLA